MEWNPVETWLIRIPRVNAGPYTVRPGDLRERPCPCCGEPERVAKGLLICPSGAPVAMYSVSWSPILPDDHPSLWRFAIPSESDFEDARRAIAHVAFARHDGRWSYMVQDAATARGLAPNPAHALLRRDEIVGTPFAKHVFDMIDAIYAQDSVLAELRDRVEQSR